MIPNPNCYQEICWPYVPEGMVEPLKYLWGLNQNGCERFQLLTDLVNLCTIGEQIQPGTVDLVIGLPQGETCIASEVASQWIVRNLNVISSNSVQLSLTSAGLTAFVITSSTAGNQLQNTGSGLYVPPLESAPLADNVVQIIDGAIYVPAPPEAFTLVLAPDSGLTGEGTSDSPLSLDPCTIPAPVGVPVLVLGKDSDGCLVVMDSTTFVRTNQLPESPVTPVSSNTVQLNASGVSNHTLTASVKIDPDPTNAIVAGTNGLYVDIGDPFANIGNAANCEDPQYVLGESNGILKWFLHHIHKAQIVEATAPTQIINPASIGQFPYSLQNITATLTNPDDCHELYYIALMRSGRTRFQSDKAGQLWRKWTYLAAPGNPTADGVVASAAFGGTTGGWAENFSFPADIRIFTGILNPGGTATFVLRNELEVLAYVSGGSTYIADSGASSIVVFGFYT